MEAMGDIVSSALAQINAIKDGSADYSGAPSRIYTGTRIFSSRGEATQDATLRSASPEDAAKMDKINAVVEDMLDRVVDKIMKYPL